MNTRTLLAVPLAFILSITGACSGGGSGGGGDAGGGPNDDPPPQQSFINWIGSANGVNVIDGYGQFFRFRADTLQLWYSGITFVNVRVTNNGAARLIWNNTDIGSVAGVQSTSGSTIAALVSNAGTFIGVYQQNGQVYWTDTHVQPVAALMAGGDAEIVRNDAEFSQDPPIDEFMAEHAVLIAAPLSRTDSQAHGVKIESLPPTDELDWPDRGTAMLLPGDDAEFQDDGVIDSGEFGFPTARIDPEDFVGAPLREEMRDEVAAESVPAPGW